MNKQNNREVFMQELHIHLEQSFDDAIARRRAIHKSESTETV